MRAERGASQILFGMLPTQTVDLEGGVWQVQHWTDPVRIPIDQETVRHELIGTKRSLLGTHTRTTGGIYTELHARTQIQVMAVNEDRGILVEPFPKQWRCRRCDRLTTSSGQRCECGSTRFAQMQFVAYHKCGRIQEPRLQRCPTHRQVAVRLPGTAAARELYFYCPVCKNRLSNGFPFHPCECGKERMTLNVHRAGTVFTPHYAVLVNPPDPAEAARLRASGGGARALDWVLDGLGEIGPGEAQQTVQGFEEAMIQQGMSPDFAREIAQRALERGEVEPGATNARLDLSDVVHRQAQDEAISLSSALKGRVRVQDMVDGSEPPLRTLYETAYRSGTEGAGLTNLELLTDFPVTTLAFGFTRDGRDPATSTLVPFREPDAIRTYGLQAHTEALLFQLNPVSVVDHLRTRGFPVMHATDARAARIALLQTMEIPHPSEENPQPLGAAVVTLLHSYAHRLIRSLTATAGIERDGLSEYLLPSSPFGHRLRGSQRRVRLRWSTVGFRDGSALRPGFVRSQRGSLPHGPGLQSGWRRMHGVSPSRRTVVPMVQPVPGPQRAVRRQGVPYRDGPMHESELFGGVLYSTTDVDAAANILAQLLRAPATDPVVADDAGLDPTLVDSLRVLDLGDASAIDRACALGAAWVSGKRSTPDEHTWEAVASVPAHLLSPYRLRRTTAETLIGLANGAKTKLRLAAPFMDEQGVGYLADSVVAATSRHVAVELIRPARGKGPQASAASLRSSVQKHGDPARFKLLDTAEGAPFPHLKVVTVDGVAAYIGSANFTAAALEGRNLEFGALVHGDEVQVIDAFLDMYSRDAAQPIQQRRFTPKDRDQPG